MPGRHDPLPPPERLTLRRKPSPSRPSLDVSGSRSPELLSILEVHQHDTEEDRLAHHWVGHRPSAQGWDLPQSLSHLVAASVPAFLEHEKLKVHGTFGERGRMPELETILTQEGSIRAPQNVTYFLEALNQPEHILLSVSKGPYGEREIRVVARDAGSWINKLRAFATRQNFLRGQVFDLSGEIVPLKGLALEDVILTPRQSEAVHRHILGFAKLVQAGTKNVTRQQRGVLLEGPPGCGKSMLLRAIATRMHGLSVCLASPRQISGGDGIEHLKSLIEMTAPCAVFMEELDIFGKDRSLRHSPAMADLMQLMDGLQNIPGILWVATTNRSQEIESALADRPGRFDRRILFEPLDDPYREQLIHQLIRPSRLESDALAWLLAKTRGYSGAQLREVCDTVRLLAIEQQLPMDDFGLAVVREAINDCRFSTSSTGFGFQAEPREISV